MRVIERGEVVSSGDGGGGTCHNEKPGQSRDKVLKRESRRVEVREELEGGSGGTCHNDKPGPNAGYGASRYDGGEGRIFFWLGAAWVKSRAERPQSAE